MVTPDSVKLKYEQEGEPLPHPTPNDINYDNFKKLAKTEITHNVNSLYRLKDKKTGIEYFFYHETLHSADRFGNPLTFYYPHLGVISMPIFEKRYDPDKDETYSTGQILGHNIQYEFEFTSANLAKIANGIDADTNFYVIAANGTKYAGLSRRDWETRPFDELVDIARFGPPKSRTRKILESKAARGEVK